MSGDVGREPVRILGIVNLTEDSFSDGGAYLDPGRALGHARRLLAEGAFAVDLGAAASHPDAKPVPAAEEIRRLEPVVDALLRDGARVSIDSFRTETQRFALSRGVAMLNDIQGFADPGFHAELAAGAASLVVMHSVQGRGPATRIVTEPERIVERTLSFFAERIATLEKAGVTRERLVLDPGMGFFLGSNPEASLAVLRALPKLRERFGLPLLLSVSRKSFLRALTGRGTAELGPATLAAELFAAEQGVDYLRTHDVAALRDALGVLAALG